MDNYPPGAANDPSEIWKPCPEFETKYLISNFGNIKSIGTYNTCKKNQLINQYKKRGRNGYMQVRLYDDNRVRTIDVHILVAKAFIPNPENLPIINHINENKVDNRASNLEWCTNQYNVRYSHSKAVNQYNKESKMLIKEWSCIAEASNNLNIPTTNISKCCSGKRYSAGGYIWMYK